MQVKEGDRGNTVRLRFFDENSRSQRRDKSSQRRDKSPSLQGLIIVETAIYRVSCLNQTVLGVKG
jgi:hypothetical protein